jgi:hypothetical protein
MMDTPTEPHILDPPPQRYFSEFVSVLFRKISQRAYLEFLERHVAHNVRCHDRIMLESPSKVVSIVSQRGKLHSKDFLTKYVVRVIGFAQLADELVLANLFPDELTWIEGRPQVVEVKAGIFRLGVSVVSERMHLVVHIFVQMPESEVRMFGRHIFGVQLPPIFLDFDSIEEQTLCEFLADHSLGGQTESHIVMWHGLSDSFFDV